MADINGGIHHVNFSVRDLDRSVQWYQRLFGVSVVTSMAADDGSWSKVITRHPGGLLLGFTQHSTNDGLEFSEFRTGVDHIAFTVADGDALPEWLSRLDELGVERSEIKTTPLGQLITLRDPDNVQIELYAPSA